MNAREGCLLRTVDGLIFDVKGVVHPPEKIVAFPRFFPHPLGNRKSGDVTYQKVYNLAERYQFLKKQHPQYLVFDPIFDELLCEVPTEMVYFLYDPIKRLAELRDQSRHDKLEAAALNFMKLLRRKSATSWQNLGISGSLLPRLHTSKSDIDPVVYGETPCIAVYEALKSELSQGGSIVKPYTEQQLKTLYKMRLQDTQISFSDFVQTESRKVLQGRFRKHDFYIRCVKDWGENGERYGDRMYRKMGYARVCAVVSDASNAIFTPCSYKVEDVQTLRGLKGELVSTISSFRGRFCEQAKEGEYITAQGKVERVQHKSGKVEFRLLLGGRNSDFMILGETAGED